MEIQHHSLQHHNEAGMDPNTHSTLKVLNFRDVCKVVAVVSQLFVPFSCNTKSPSDCAQPDRLWDGSQVRATCSNRRLGNFILQNHKYQISTVKKIFFFKSSTEERTDLSFLTSLLQHNFSSFSCLCSNHKRASHKKLLGVTHLSKNFSHICDERVSLVGQCKVLGPRCDKATVSRIS